MDDFFTGDLGMEIPKRLNFMQIRNQSPTMTELRTPELRYAYYRRCQQFRHNGAQCKAPALKGERICHQHTAQAVTARRRQESLRALRMPSQFNDFRSIQRAIAEAARALIDGRIDSKTAGRLAITLQNASLRLRKKFTTETRRHGEFSSEISSAVRDPYRLENQPQTPVILSAAPRKLVPHEADGRGGEGSRRCFGSQCGIKAFSRELPYARLSHTHSRSPLRRCRNPLVPTWLLASGFLASRLR